MTTQATLRYHDTIEVSVGYSASVVEAIKSLPVASRAWNATTKVWVVSAELEEVLVALLKAQGLTVTWPDETEKEQHGT